MQPCSQKHRRTYDLLVMRVSVAAAATIPFGYIRLHTERGYIRLHTERLKTRHAPEKEQLALGNWGLDWWSGMLVHAVRVAPRPVAGQPCILPVGLPQAPIGEQRRAQG
jgi:hypothetical protein